MDSGIETSEDEIQGGIGVAYGDHGTVISGSKQAGPGYIRTIEAVQRIVRDADYNEA